MNPSQANWIEAPVEGPEAPLLRREFLLLDTPVEARLRICGLGCFEAWINGQKVGDHVLDPAQTDYEERVFYLEFPVGRLLRHGLNCLGVMLGNGWYHQDRVWGAGGLSYGRPRLWAQLEVRMADGSAARIETDGEWASAPGPVTDNNLYSGEHYDARLEIPGWAEPGSSAGQWEPIRPANPPGGELLLQPIPPMRRVEELAAVSLETLEPGLQVADFGQNFSGWVRLRMEAPEGTEMRLRFAENRHPDGRIDSASTGVFATRVEQVDRYICRGGGPEIWEPRFTYHGFRYVELSGQPVEFQTGDLTGVVVHTDLKTAGGFNCGEERLNTLHRMALWTHRSNIHGIPEDCPARERCGWLGDAIMVAEYSMWNFQARSFWEKYIGDIETTRKRNKGLPFNIAPGKRTCPPPNADWMAAFILLPWFVHLHYGTLEPALRHWDGMSRLIDHFLESAPDGILHGGLGDWFDPGGDRCCSHTSPDLTTTIWLHQCAGIMSRFARLLGHPGRAASLEKECTRIRTAFLQAFFDDSRGGFGSQTADAMALHFGMVPEGREQQVLDNLVADIRERDTHLNTGIMGVRFLFEVLTRNGHGELALAVMRQDTYPGFGDWIRRGATTLWEYWGEAQHDRERGARSHNHPMMGGFDNWFFNTLAGIRPDPDAPGFECFFLEPHPVQSIGWLEAWHDSPRGRIRSRWQFADGNLSWESEVPPGSRATARLPGTFEYRELPPGRHAFTLPWPGSSGPL